jgi:hypothetical protein
VCDEPRCRWVGLAELGEARHQGAGDGAVLGARQGVLDVDLRLLRRDVREGHRRQLERAFVVVAQRRAQQVERLVRRPGRCPQDGGSSVRVRSAVALLEGAPRARVAPPEQRSEVVRRSEPGRRRAAVLGDGVDRRLHALVQVAVEQDAAVGGDADVARRVACAAEPAREQFGLDAGVLGAGAAAEARALDAVAERVVVAIRVAVHRRDDADVAARQFDELRVLVGRASEPVVEHLAIHVDGDQQRQPRLLLHGQRVVERALPLDRGLRRRRILGCGEQSRQQCLGEHERADPTRRW